MLLPRVRAMPMALGNTRRCMNRHLPLLCAIALLVPPLSGQADGVSSPPPVASAGRSGAVGHAEGTIIGIDAEHGRITLKHGVIEGLGMPAMTMVFRVAEPVMLAQLKPGDWVRFTTVRADNFFTVTELRVAARR